DSIVYDGTEFFRMGNWGLGGRNFNGEIDELQVYNRALTVYEIKAIKGERLVPALTIPGIVLLIGFLAAAAGWIIWKNRARHSRELVQQGKP
ncbi:MAG: hypothetical protein ACRECJ_08395, partial [Limisphaerales bacterium]